jgi:hypothetical protein
MRYRDLGSRLLIDNFHHASRIARRFFTLETYADIFAFELLAALKARGFVKPKRTPVTIWLARILKYARSKHPSMAKWKPVLEVYTNLCVIKKLEREL